MSGIANMVFANHAAPVSAVSDPYWADVGLLLHMDGSNGGTTFTDSSNTGSVWTATEGANTDTGTKKWGTASYEMTAISTDSPMSRGIIWANSSTYTDIKMTGNFTFEFWYYTSNTNLLKGILSYGFFSFLIYVNGLAVTMEASSTDYNVSGVEKSLSLGSITANTWNHIAVCRNSNTVQAWINGTRTLNNTTFFTDAIRTYRTSDGAIAHYMSFGSTSHNQTTQHMGGYLDDVRVTQDVIRYSGATITVPDAAFPNS